MSPLGRGDLGKLEKISRDCHVGVATPPRNDNKK